jgi:hypothetical protein
VLQSIDGAADTCWAGDQARAVVALWLTAQALPDGERLLRAHQLGLHPNRYDQQTIDAAATLLAQPRQRMTDFLAAHWREVTDPASGIEALAPLGVTGSPNNDQEPSCR